MFGITVKSRLKVAKLICEQPLVLKSQLGVISLQFKWSSVDCLYLLLFTMKERCDQKLGVICILTKPVCSLSAFDKIGDEG
jgi:hypothetical protein